MFVSFAPCMNETAQLVQADHNFCCDECTYCSQMGFCAKVKFFLQNYSNIEMDDDRDGIPSDPQWCH